MGKCKSCDKDTCQYCNHRRWFFGWYCDRDMIYWYHWYLLKGEFCPLFEDKLRYLE